MTPFEWLALGYFGGCSLLAARAGVPRAVRYAAAAMLLVIVARFAFRWEVRAWVAHAYLVLGYWIPATFAPRRVNNRFEQWLRRADALLLPPRGSDLPPKGGSYRPEGGSSRPEDGGSRPVASALRRKAIHFFELAYLLCYPMVPAAFTIVFLHGDRDDVTRFWTAVLVAGFACYGTLPWTVAPPPRLKDAPDAKESSETTLLARINRHVLGRVSHNLNTFPSGHVAVSLAAALAVSLVSLSWGVAFFGMAIAIAVAAVAGRYHYLVDVLVGLAVGGLAFVTTALLRGLDA